MIWAKNRPPKAAENPRQNTPPLKNRVWTFKGGGVFRLRDPPIRAKTVSTRLLIMIHSLALGHLSKYLFDTAVAVHSPPLHAWTAPFPKSSNALDNTVPCDECSTSFVLVRRMDPHSGCRLALLCLVSMALYNYHYGKYQWQWFRRASFSN